MPEPPARGAERAGMPRAIRVVLYCFIVDKEYVVSGRRSMRRRRARKRRNQPRKTHRTGSNRRENRQWRQGRKKDKAKHDKQAQVKKDSKNDAVKKNSSGRQGRQDAAAARKRPFRARGTAGPDGSIKGPAANERTTARASILFDTASKIRKALHHHHHPIPHWRPPMTTLPKPVCTPPEKEELAEGSRRPRAWEKKAGLLRVLRSGQHLLPHPIRQHGHERPFI